ncbi:hypothetical protein ACJX0J_008054 [Zea mays]
MTLLLILQIHREHENVEDVFYKTHESKVQISLNFMSPIKITFVSSEQNVYMNNFHRIYIKCIMMFLLLRTSFLICNLLAIYLFDMFAYGTPVFSETLHYAPETIEASKQKAAAASK